MTHHQSSNFLRIALATFCGVFFLAASASATLWVRVADESLVRQTVDRGGVIVEVEAGDWNSAYQSSTPSTHQSMLVHSVIHGDLAGADELTVRWRGGLTADGSLLTIHGVEPLAPGSTAVLFLKPGRAGTWDALHLFQGVFETVHYEGRDYAFRSLGGVEVDLSGDKTFAEAERARELKPFVRWVRGIAEGRAPAADYWSDVPVDALRATAAEQSSDKYTLFTNPFRWRAFDSGTNITLFAHQNGQPGLAGGGFGEFLNAINVWNNDPGSDVFYRYGGKTGASGGFNGQDFVNSLIFDDLNGAGDFDEPFNCFQGGTIAVGGGYAFQNDHIHQGRLFGRLVEVDIVTNDNTDCVLGNPATAREVFGHELGHTLGLGHSCGGDAPSCSGKPLLNDALMRATVHADGRGARLNADDRSGINYLYPAEAQLPPTAPTGLSASNAGLGVVNLSWNDTANNETGFQIERSVSQGFSQIASVGANSGFYQDAAAPTGSNVSYRVRAFNGAGNSGYTNTAAVTTAGPTPPSALLATSLSPHEIRLDWVYNAADAKEFEIQIRRQPAAEFTFATFAKVAPGSTQVVLGELFTDTSFEFRIRVVTDAGNSSWSVPTTGVTLPYQVGAPCEPGLSTLCLNGGRFQNRVLWRNFDELAGRGRRIATDESTDSGLFWFFGDDNWEMLIKNLNACTFNEHVWVFSAASTTVEYTHQVVDTWTGEAVTYFNSIGANAPAVTDIEAFGATSCNAPAPAGLGQAELLELPSDSSAADLGLVDKTAGCSTVTTGTDTTLFLNDGRFEVEVDWLDFEGKDGPGHVVQFCSADSGLFWFFGKDNWELLIKVLDACTFNERFWVFAAATTNVQYSLHVTDTESGVTQTYFNPLGQTSTAITDTSAFATCP